MQGSLLKDTQLVVKDEQGECIEEGIGSCWLGGDRRVCLLDDETCGTGYVNIWLPLRLSLTQPADYRMRDTGDMVRINKGSGSIYYVGRKDNQVKISGQRINLAEIEGTLLRCPSTPPIRQCKYLPYYYSSSPLTGISG